MDRVEVVTLDIIVVFPTSGGKVFTISPMMYNVCHIFIVDTLCHIFLKFHSIPRLLKTSIMVEFYQMIFCDY